MEYQTITVNNEKWVRSPDGILAGVCQGLSGAFKVDPWIVRILWIASVLTFGVGLGLYIILAVSLPRQDKANDAYSKRILGVCSRVARKLEIEVGLVRAGAIVLGLMSAGAVVVGYIILHFILDQQGNHGHWRQPRISSRI